MRGSTATSDAASSLYSTSGTWISRMSSVITIANTPSLKASTRFLFIDVLLCLLPSRSSCGVYERRESDLQTSAAVHRAVSIPLWGVFADPSKKVHSTKSGGSEPGCVRQHLLFRYGQPAHRASENDHCAMARHAVSKQVSERLARSVSDVQSFHGAV